jgi:hypothetical protein
MVKTVIERQILCGQRCDPEKRRPGSGLLCVDWTNADGFATHPFSSCFRFWHEMIPSCVILVASQILQCGIELVPRVTWVLVTKANA